MTSARLCRHGTWQRFGRSGRLFDFGMMTWSSIIRDRSASSTSGSVATVFHADASGPPSLADIEDDVGSECRGKHSSSTLPMDDVEDAALPASRPLRLTVRNHRHRDANPLSIATR